MALSDEETQRIRKSFHKSVQQIKEARSKLKDGVCCDCGGIMRYTDGVYLCPVNPGDPLGGKMVDKFAIQCDKCGKKDFFVVKVDHI